jgi:hypothetical protein
MCSLSTVILSAVVHIVLFTILSESTRELPRHTFPIHLQLTPTTSLHLVCTDYVLTQYSENSDTRTYFTADDYVPTEPFSSFSYSFVPETPADFFNSAPSPEVELTDPPTTSFQDEVDEVLNGIMDFICENIASAVRHTFSSDSPLYHTDPADDFSAPSDEVELSEPPIYVASNRERVDMDVDQEVHGT